MSERCPKCDAPARNMPPDGDYRYDNRVLRSAVARAEAAEAEVERLKGVLGWYADENNWRDQPILRMDHLGRECEDQAPAEIYDDYGARARSALEAKP